MNIEAFCRTLTVLRLLAGQYVLRNVRKGKRADPRKLREQVTNLRSLVDELERMLDD